MPDQEAIGKVVLTIVIGLCAIATLMLICANAGLIRLPNL